MTRLKIYLSIFIASFLAFYFASYEKFLFRNIDDYVNNIAYTIGGSLYISLIVFAFAQLRTPLTFKAVSPSPFWGVLLVGLTAFGGRYAALSNAGLDHRSATIEAFWLLPSVEILVGLGGVLYFWFARQKYNCQPIVQKNSISEEIAINFKKQMRLINNNGDINQLVSVSCWSVSILLITSIIHNWGIYCCGHDSFFDFVKLSVTVVSAFITYVMWQKRRNFALMFAVSNFLLFQPVFPVEPSLSEWAVISIVSVTGFIVIGTRDHLPALKLLISRARHHPRFKGILIAGTIFTAVAVHMTYRYSMNDAEKTVSDASIDEDQVTNAAQLNDDQAFRDYLMRDRRNVDPALVPGRVNARIGVAAQPDAQAQFGVLAKRYGVPVAVVENSPELWEQRAASDEAQRHIDAAPKLGR